MKSKTIPTSALRTLPKEVRAILVKALATEGWRGHKTSKCHFRFYPADRSKAPITVSSSPSDRRHVYENVKTDFRNAGLDI